MYFLISYSILFIIFTQPLHRIWHKVNFYAEFNRFEFRVFLLLVASPRLKNLVCPTILPIAGGRIIGFIPFPMVLVLCEMQSVSSRIWTRVAVFISYDDNHYTTGTSHFILFIVYFILLCKTLTHSCNPTLK